MRTIVVGVDLSPASEAAVGHAVALGRRTGATVVVALASTAPDPTPSSLADADRAMWPVFEVYAARAHQLRVDDRRDLAALTARWADRGVAVESIVVEGRPEEALPTLAQQRSADLLVVGSHGRTGLRRALLGSVAERIVRFAPMSVYVARGHAAEAGPARVVVATDFTEAAAPALTAAFEVAAPGASLELVTCWRSTPTMVDPELVMAIDEAAIRRDVEADFQARAAAALEDAPRTDLTTSFHLAPQDPPWGVIDRAASQHADLVVIGSHGRRGLKRWVLGSVAEATVRHATCSVLVARENAAR